MSRREALLDVGTFLVADVLEPAGMKFLVVEALLLTHWLGDAIDVQVRNDHR